MNQALSQGQNEAEAERGKYTPPERIAIVLLSANRKDAAKNTAVLHATGADIEVTGPKALDAAYLIAAAPALLEQVRLFERVIEYEIRVSRHQGDDEGAGGKAITLHLVREVLAKAEGRTLAKPGGN